MGAQERKLPLASFELATSLPANRLLFLNPPQLALGNEPSLPAHRAENTVIGNLFTKAPKQTLLRLVRPEANTSQLFHHLSFIFKNSLAILLLRSTQPSQLHHLLTLGLVPLPAEP